MKRLTFTLAVILLANCTSTAVFGCDAGGFRPRIRSFSAPRYYGSPIRRVVHRPAQTFQPISMCPSLQQPSPSFPQAAPQIRLAPTQRANRELAGATQATSNAQRVPAVQQPQRTQQQPQPTQKTPSALDILAGDPAPTQNNPQRPANQPTQNHIGTWQAKTPNNASVTLSLNADGSFDWIAESNGKTSRFAGRFTVSDGKLTLSRSSDNQKLVGQFMFSGNHFNFKLDGAKDSGLDFRRQS